MKTWHVVAAARRRQQDRLARAVADELDLLLDDPRLAHLATQIAGPDAVTAAEAACDRISNSADDLETFQERVERCLVRRGAGDQQRANKLRESAVDWLGWVFRMLRKGVEFLIAHPAILKVLLALLLGFMDEAELAGAWIDADELE